MSFDLYVIHMKDGDPAQADRQAVQDVFERCGNAWKRTRSSIFVLFACATSRFPSCASFTKSRWRDMMVANGQGHGTEDSPSTLVVNDAQRQHLWPDPGVVRVVTSPVELAQALVGDVSAWQGYRDQVVAGSQSSAE